MENSKIEWTDHTFNPWTGCTKVSPACDHCYAESWAKRSGTVQWGNHRRRRTTEANWRQPLKWNRDAKAAGVRRRVFCASLADVFDNQVDGAWRCDLWDLIAETQYLDWLLLTKRPQNICPMLPRRAEGALLDWGPGGLHNVWLGCAAENQQEADRRIPFLLEIPARGHFLSCEPLLGALDLGDWITDIGWVICGGESGAHARPMHPEWARGLREQCTRARVPFFFKQWGEWAPSYGRADVPRRAVSIYDGGGIDIGPNDMPRQFDLLDRSLMWRPGKKAAGALLDGCECREFPA